MKSSGASLNPADQTIAIDLWLKEGDRWSPDNAIDRNPKSGASNAHHEFEDQDEITGALSGAKATRAVARQEHQVRARVRRPCHAMLSGRLLDGPFWETSETALPHLRTIGGEA